MTRTRFRPAALALGSLLATALVGTAAAGQTPADFKVYRDQKDLVPPQLKSDDISRLADLSRGQVRTAGPDLKSNQELFLRFAKTHLYRVFLEQYYLTPDTGELRPRNPEHNFDGVLQDLDSRILVPTPDSKLNVDQADYIKEMGKALDATFRAVLLKLPPPANRTVRDTAAIIRVNTGRLMVAAARSGAPAHAKTIQELLTNQFYKAGDKPVQTPPELLYYALKSAEALLAAYDPMAQALPAYYRHTVPEAELVTLVAAIEGLILKNPPVADRAAELNPDKPSKAVPLGKPDDQQPEPAAKPKDPAPGTLDPKMMAPEQVALVQFYRRAAVRALAEVRVDVIGGEAGIPQVRPAYTLAKVAASDNSIVPAPSASEIAEAVIGLCGLHPSTTLQVDETAQVIAYGVRLFAGAQTDDRGKSTQDPATFRPALPWKTYAARMALAFNGLKRRTQTNPRLRQHAAALNALADAVISDITTPIEKDDSSVGGVPITDKLTRWAEQYPPKDPNRSLYNDSPQYKLSVRPAGG